MLHSGESRGETMSLVHMAASVSLAYSQSDTVMVCGINSWSLLLDSQALFLAPGEESHTSKPETRCINIGLLEIGRQKEGGNAHAMWQKDSGTNLGSFPAPREYPEREGQCRVRLRNGKRKPGQACFQRVCSFTHSTGTDQTSRTCQLLFHTFGKHPCATQRALSPLLLYFLGGRKTTINRNKAQISKG